MTSNSSPTKDQGLEENMMTDRAGRYRGSKLRNAILVSRRRLATLVLLTVFASASSPALADESIDALLGYWDGTASAMGSNGKLKLDFATGAGGPELRVRLDLGPAQIDSAADSFSVTDSAVYFRSVIQGMPSHFIGTRNGEELSGTFAVKNGDDILAEGTWSVSPGEEVVVPAPVVHVDGPKLIPYLDANQSDVVFTFAGELWMVARAGGTAVKLEAPAGEKILPSFSPDGEQLAFTVQAGRSADVYVAEIKSGELGEVTRLTHHPKADYVRGWSPDGSALIFSSRRVHDGYHRLYRISTDGQFPNRVPVRIARDASFSPNGKQLTFVEHGYDHTSGRFRYYRGGLNLPIRITNLDDGKTREIPCEGSSDRLPTWIGDDIYFLSDRNGIFNLYRYEDTRKVAPVTEYGSHGIKAMGAASDAIVFVRDGEIHLFDIATDTTAAIKVTFDLEAPELAPRTALASSYLAAMDLSADGTLTMEARGDIFVRTESSGVWKNITKTPGVAERRGVTSPDGKRVAYFSDASGEYELYISNLDGSGVVTRHRIETEPMFYDGLSWSPDGHRLTFSDPRLNLWIIDAQAGGAYVVDRSNHIGQGLYAASWSPDGRWLAYAKAEDHRVRSIFIHDCESKKTGRVTDGTVHAESPVFDASGRYLYFTTSSTARLASAGDLSWGVLSSIHNRPLVTKTIHMFILREGDTSPVLPIAGVSKTAAWSQVDRVEIDFEDPHRRIVQLGIDRMNYDQLFAGPAGVIYPSALKWPGTLGLLPSPEASSLYRVDLKEGDDLVEIDADYEWALVAGDRILVTNDESNILLSDGADIDSVRAAGVEIDLTAAEIDVDPSQEWPQMLTESLRVLRDYFYDPGHHGQDVDALQAYYETYLPSITRRADLNALITHAVGQVSVSHLSIRGGDTVGAASKDERVGLLGAEYEIDTDSNKYRFARIYQSGHISAENRLERAPLDQPGVNVQEGEFLLAVNGTPIDASKNLYTYFVGTAWTAIEIEVGPRADGRDSRTYQVVAYSGTNSTQRADWARRNKARVDELSDGQVGYVYVADHSRGLADLARGILAHQDKDAIIIDQRYSPGGIVSDSFIEWLKRESIYAYDWRHGKDLPMPTNAVRGSTVLLANEFNGSAAETFAHMYKQAEIGTIVGKSTFGAGIGGALSYQQLMDGGSVRVPNRGAYNVKGSWDLEGSGVEPDVDVDYRTEDFWAGIDPQLEKAVDVALSRAGHRKKWAPKSPEYRQLPRDVVPAGSSMSIR